MVIVKGVYCRGKNHSSLYIYLHRLIISRIKPVHFFFRSSLLWGNLTQPCHYIIIFGNIELKHSRKKHKPVSWVTKLVGIDFITVLKWEEKTGNYTIQKAHKPLKPVIVAMPTLSLSSSSSWRQLLLFYMKDKKGHIPFALWNFDFQPTWFFLFAIM